MAKKRKKSFIGWTNVNWDMEEQEYEKEHPHPPSHTSLYILLKCPSLTPSCLWLV